MKNITLKIPSWMDKKRTEEEFKQLLFKKIEDMVKEDYVDPEVYMTYLELSGFTSATSEVSYSLEQELEFLENMREKGRKRVENS